MVRLRSMAAAVPANRASVWEPALMSGVREHCVPTVLVVMAVCMYWLQETPWLQAASRDSAPTQLLGIDNIVCGVLAVLVVSPQVSTHVRAAPSRATRAVRYGNRGSGQVAGLQKRQTPRAKADRPFQEQLWCSERCFRKSPTVLTGTHDALSARGQAAITVSKS